MYIRIYNYKQEYIILTPVFYLILSVWYRNQSTFDQESGLSELKLPIQISLPCDVSDKPKENQSSLTVKPLHHPAVTEAADPERTDFTGQDRLVRFIFNKNKYDSN